MKRMLLFAFCALIFALPLCASADDYTDFPFADDPFEDRNDGDLEAPNTEFSQNIEVVIDGTPHTLAFDPSPEYSSIKDGMVQASFFEYEGEKGALYELYLIFPEDVQPDSRVDADYSIQNDKECSVVLIVSDSTSERYYVSGVMNRRLYPEGSGFSMSFDFANGSDFGGTLSAQLVALDLSSGSVLGTMEIENATFKFTMAGDSTERHSEPLPTEAPSDLRRV